MIDVLADREPAGSLALASGIPFEQQRGQVRSRVAGESGSRVDEVTEVTPAYFEVLRIPVVAGRSFTRGDRGRDIVVVNQTLAEAFWPTRQAVGKTITIGNTVFEVIGVVKDVATSRGVLRNGSVTAAYRPLTPDSASRGVVPRVLVPSNGPTSSTAVAGEVKAIDPVTALRCE